MIQSRLHQKNLLQVPIESITRSRVNKLKYAFNDLIQNIKANVDFKEPISANKN